MLPPKKQLEEVLDAQFPKGKCKERGAAMVLFAESLMLIKQVEATRYWKPCSGCPEGHPSFWKTIIESPEWKKWQDEQKKRFSKLSRGKKITGVYDMSEVEECGRISPKHWADFLEFVKKI